MATVTRSRRRVRARTTTWHGAGGPGPTNDGGESSEDRWDACHRTNVISKLLLSAIYFNVSYFDFVQSVWCHEVPAQALSSTTLTNEVGLSSFSDLFLLKVIDIETLHLI